MSSIEYGKEIKLSNEKIIEADNTSMRNCIPLHCGRIYTSTSCRKVTRTQQVPMTQRKMSSERDIVSERYHIYGYIRTPSYAYILLFTAAN